MVIQTSGGRYRKSPDFLDMTSRFDIAEMTSFPKIVVGVPIFGSIAYYLSRRKKNPGNAK